MNKSAGDAMPPGCRFIEVRVRELRQLYNEIDPSPFHDRDLAPDAEQFIVETAREVPRGDPVGLVVHHETPGIDPHAAADLREAVHRHFRREADSTRRRLRVLFRRGRVSLAIGLGFLALTGILASRVPGVSPGEVGGFLHDSLIIGGWVAMWRPLEVFLYEWWPILAEARLFDRLASMPVRIDSA